MTAWPSRQLSEVAEAIDYGLTAAATTQPVGPKFLRITDIQDGSVNWATVPWCRADGRSLSSFRLKGGDIVFARTGATTGKSFLVRECPEEAVFASYLIRVRLNDSIDPRFVSYFFDTPDYWRQIAQNARGAAQPGVNATKLKGLVVPLPPLPEQRRIADVLDQADRARFKRRQSIGQADDLARSIFLDMFGSRDQASGHWVKVTDLVAAGDAIRTGPFGSQLLHSEFQPQGVAVLGIDSAVTNEFRWIEGRCISEAKYRQLKRYTVCPGDVLITIMGTCGRCAIVPDGLPPAINTKHLCCITLDKAKCLPEFLHAYFLWHPVARRYLEGAAKGAIMSGLNMGIIKALPVPVIPLTDQETFVARREACLRLRSNLRSSLSRLDELFLSIRQRAFADAL